MDVSQQSFSGELSMPRKTTQEQRFIALFLVGNLLFNYPLLFLFNQPLLLLGIPLLLVYLFCAWALLIGLIALVAESS